MLPNIGNLKDSHILIILVILSFCINYSWLSFSVISFSDYGYKFENTLADYSNLSSWVFRSGLGAPDILIWRTPFLLIQSIIGHLGFGLNVADKFSLLWIWIILSAVAPYLLVKEITNSKIAGIFSSLLFSYNTYFISINSAGHFNISVASAITVLSLFFILKINRSANDKFIILSSISLFAVGVYDLRVLYIALGTVIFYLIFNLVIYKKVNLIRFSYIVKNLKVFLYLGLLNAFWILPMIVSKSYSGNQVLSRGLFGDQFWSLEAAIALFHPFWNGKEPDWFVIQKIPIYFYLIPVIALIGVLWNRKNLNIVFFALLTLIGIFLAKQSDPPFGGFYGFFYENLPGFNAFREASKFYILIAIGFSVLIGGFYAKFVNSKKYAHKLVRLIIILLIPVYVLIIIKPIISGEIGSTYTSRELPQDSKVVNEFISEQSEYFRTLVLPTYPRSWPYTNNHPRISFVNNLDDNWSIQFGLEGLTSDEKIKFLLSQKFSNLLLDQSSIKYLAIPKREEVKKDDFFLFYGSDKPYYVNLLKELDYLQPIDIGLKETLIFENLNFRPKIYRTLLEENLDVENSFIPINYKKRGESIYDFRIENVKDKVFINFTEIYNPKWVFSIGGLKIFNSNILPSPFHKINGAGMNSFLIDKDFIIKNIPPTNFQVNPDKSISFNASINYYPDTFLIIGAMISILSFIFLIYRLISKK